VVQQRHDRARQPGRDCEDGGRAGGIAADEHVRARAQGRDGSRAHSTVGNAMGDCGGRHGDIGGRGEQETKEGRLRKKRGQDNRIVFDGGRAAARIFQHAVHDGGGGKCECILR